LNYIELTLKLIDPFPKKDIVLGENALSRGRKSEIRKAS